MIIVERERERKRERTILLFFSSLHSSTRSLSLLSPFTADHRASSSFTRPPTVLRFFFFHLPPFFSFSFPFPFPSPSFLFSPYPVVCFKNRVIYYRAPDRWTVSIRSRKHAHNGHLEEDQTRDSSRLRAANRSTISPPRKSTRACK